MENDKSNHTYCMVVTRRVKMKIIANNYSEKDVMKIMREWSDKKQDEFGKSIGLSGMTIQGYERGIRRYTFETLMKVAKKYGYIITIEKK